MKKYLYYIALAAATLTGCSTSDLDEMATTLPRQTLNVALPMSDDPTTRILMTDGESSVKLDWEEEDTFSLYSTDGIRITDFKFSGQNSDGSARFAATDEQVQLSDGIEYTAIYPAIADITTIDKHRAEIERIIAEQKQTGNNDNSHIGEALSLESQFTYDSATSSAAITFEHKSAAMRITFATEAGKVPTRVIFRDGDSMSYILNLAEVSESESYTVNFVIMPSKSTQSREVKFVAIGDGFSAEFTKETDIEYTTGIQYRSELKSSDFNYTAYDRPQNFYRRHLIYKFTATWCTYCPNMTTALEKASELYPDRLIEAAMHNEDDLTVSYVTPQLCEYLRIYGYPSAIFDMNKDYSVESYDTQTIVDLAKKSLEENPTVCGIAIPSVKLEDNKLKIDVKAEFAKAGEYRLVVMTLESGFNLPQSGADDTYHQNHVFRNFLHASDSQNYLGEYIGHKYYGDTIERSYEIGVNSDTDLSKIEIVACILNNYDGRMYYVNNAISCKGNESADFKYE